MRPNPHRAALAAALVLLVTLALAPSAAQAAAGSGDHDGGRLSIDVALPLSLLKAAGRDSNVHISCDADADSETAAMIASLRRQGRRGVVRGRDDDGRWEARRQGDRFELKAWNLDDDEKLLLAIPWPLAECLLGGGDGRNELTARDLFGHHYEVRFEGEDGRIRFTLD